MQQQVKLFCPPPKISVGFGPGLTQNHQSEAQNLRGIMLPCLIMLSLLIHLLSKFHCLAALDPGQVWSSHSIVSSPRNVGPCRPRGGQWIGHWRTTRLTVCSSAPHSQAAEEAMPHLHKQERKHLTPVRRRLSWAQAVRGRVIPGMGSGVGDENAELYAEPYQPHSITPNWGANAVTGGPKFQSRHHLAPQRRLRSPKLKYEALEISDVRVPFERKVHCSYFRPLWRQGIFKLQLLLGAS